MRFLKILLLLIFLILILTLLSTPSVSEAFRYEESNLVSGFQSLSRVVLEPFQQNAEYSVTDTLNRTVQFQKPPERIVLAGKGLFMLADAIYLFPEATDKIVALGPAYQGSGNFIEMIDPSFIKKISLENNAGPEQIAAAQPDLVIMKSINAEKVGASLEILGIPVVYLDFETPDQYQRDLKTLGEIFQNQARAEQVAAFYQAKGESISSMVSRLTDGQRPDTLILSYSEKGGIVAFNVPPRNWMQTLIIKEAGGNPVWEDVNMSGSWSTVNFEQIAAWNPDVIFITSYFIPVDNVVDELLNDPRWQLLDAVKRGKVYGFASDVYSWDQPDPRWILGLTWVAQKLHPGFFSSVNMIEEAQLFYEQLYGMDVTAFQQKILPVFTDDVY